MLSLTQARSPPCITAIFGSVEISAVYSTLNGGSSPRAGSYPGRAPAVSRGSAPLRMSNAALYRTTKRLRLAFTLPGSRPIRRRRLSRTEAPRAGKFPNMLLASGSRTPLGGRHAC
jgi:hypothetical protein